MSSSALAGPVSNAMACVPGGATVTLAIPPRFSATGTPGRPRSHSTSTALTSGAPCPPAATSRLRRSATTAQPVRSAIQAGWPSCSVPRTAPSATQWKTVWPCATTRSARPAHSCAFAAAATSANACPIAVSSRQTSSNVVAAGGSAAAIRARSSWG